MTPSHHVRMLTQCMHQHRRKQLKKLQHKIRTATEHEPVWGGETSQALDALCLLTAQPQDQARLSAHVHLSFKITTMTQ